MGFFDFVRRQDGDTSDLRRSDEPDRAEQMPAVADAGRRQLLDDIAAFLLAHRLDVTPDNLLVAHQALSGANPALARAVTEHQVLRREITSEWLLSTARSLGVLRDRQGELDRTMRRMEELLARLLAASHDAGDAANDFGAALGTHAEALEGLDATRFDPAAMAALTRAMIARTREVEAEMRRAEREAQKLRDSLKRAQRDAELDYLTGLPNRRAFDALFEREYREARLAPDHLCVAFCDIDHFKRINDTFGHPVGDRVIQAVAHHLRGISNGKCHVARHGGEEFVLLFRGLDIKQAAAKLDAARTSFAKRRLINRDTDEPIGSVTFSGGIANVFAHETPSEALRAADMALYTAKAAGRNCVRIATEPGSA